MSVGINIGRKFINGRRASKSQSEEFQNDFPGNEESYSKLFSKQNRRYTTGAIILSLAIAGVSLAASLLISGKIDMLVVILSLTTLAIVSSFIPFVSKAQKSYDAGMYLVLIFSFTVASMVDITQIDISEGLWLIAYISYSIFISLAIQILLSKIFKTDADTSIISSVALINSPLFVPMIAQSMKNKSVIISGITVGIVGYAIGNYLGVFVAGIL